MDHYLKNEKTILEVKDLTITYKGNGKTSSDQQALYDVDLRIPKNKVTALIGSSGCGKSTLLKSLNRMLEVNAVFEKKGEILYHGREIYDPMTDVVELRRSVGMVFQKPTPFPKNIYENVAYGLRIQEGKYKDSNFITTSYDHLTRYRRKKKNFPRTELDQIVESSLQQAGLLNEVKDRLFESGLDLSGGQHQRLCIARAIAVKPEVLLMDEPCSALDPTSTAKIEELIEKLKKKYTIVIVTHNMEQAMRVSDYTAFLNKEDNGKGAELIEVGPTEKIFSNPNKKETENYITGKFG